jgi:hypothetical protein
MLELRTLVVESPGKGVQALGRGDQGSGRIAESSGKTRAHA